MKFKLLINIWKDFPFLAEKLKLNQQRNKTKLKLAILKDWLYQSLDYGEAMKQLLSWTAGWEYDLLYISLKINLTYIKIKDDYQLSHSVLWKQAYRN